MVHNLNFFFCLIEVGYVDHKPLTKQFIMSKYYYGVGGFGYLQR